ncbi:nucleoside ABC transporter membrane protein [Lachnospiraceae bacterium]|nr:nucleoside ABC transporter membrane protein [Lachnospiraceae bacterium]
MIDNIIIDGLAFALPMFIMAIGGIFSEKSGITNLALEGLQGFGAFFGAFTAVLLMQQFGGSSQVPYYVSFIAAVIGGMLFSLVHVVMCIKFKANQVISGVVVNILAAALTSFLTKRLNEGIFEQTSNKFVLGTSVRFSVPGISRIPVLGAFFRNVYPFEVIIVIIAVVMWYIMYKTPFGMHLRACGDNPHAADAAGINVNRVRLISVVISGGLSAIAGMSYAYSITANFSPDIYLGFGYLSIAALIFGNWSILPTLGACLIFGFARSGGQMLIQQLGMPSTYNDLVRIIPYVLTLLLLIFFSKHNNSPRALGEIYDKGKR